MKYINIYGAIGYSVLTLGSSYLLLLADMHDTLQGCEDSVVIVDWFKSKFNTSKILLEEVYSDERKDGTDAKENSVQLKELWTVAPHTQGLKKLYLSEPDKINAIDIRPFLMPYSLEVILIKPEGIIIKDMILKDYLEALDLFFTIKHPLIINKLENYNIDKIKHTKLGKHFMSIKKNYYQFLIKYKDLMNRNIKDIVTNELIENFNDILSDAMEWYSCACVNLYENNSIIIHAGLAHTEKILDWLITHYNYKLVEQFGTNKLEYNNGGLNTNMLNGCISLSKDIDKQFGGYHNY